MDRYVRQTLLPYVGEAGQRCFKESRVLVVGAGGLGCPALMYLVGSGFGQIGIIDFDLVDLSNLQRQVLFREYDIGHLKVDSAKETLLALNGEVVIDVFPKKLTAVVAQEIWDQYDYILDCSDNFDARYVINDACVRTGKIFISAAVDGWQGQLALYAPHQGDCGCYRCIFPHPPEAQTRCIDAGILGPVVGMMGVMQVLELQKYILGLSDLVGCMICYDFLNHTQKKMKTCLHQACTLFAS